MDLYASDAVIPSDYSHRLRMTASNMEINLLDVLADNSERTVQFQTMASRSVNNSLLSQDSTSANQEVTFTIPKDVVDSKPNGLFTNTSTRSRVSFIVYHNSKLYKQRQPREDMVMLNGTNVILPDNPVIAADITGTDTRNLTQPITFKIRKPSIGGHSLNYTCVYWDPEEGRWSTEGVYVIHQTEDEIECEAYHMTSFSILFVRTLQV